MKRQLTKFEKILLVTVFLIVAFYFYLSQIYDPVMKEFEDTNKKLNQLRGEIEEQGTVPSSRSISRKVDEKKAEVKRVRIELEKAQAAFQKAQTGVAVTNVLSEISGLATRNGVFIQTINFMQILPAQEDNEKFTSAIAYFDWQEYEVVVDGSYHGLLGFIKAVRDLDNYILIKDLKIEAGEKPNTYILSMNLCL